MARISLRHQSYRSSKSPQTRTSGLSYLMATTRFAVSSVPVGWRPSSGVKYLDAGVRETAAPAQTERVGLGAAARPSSADPPPPPLPPFTGAAPPPLLPPFPAAPVAHAVAPTATIAPTARKALCAQTIFGAEFRKSGMRRLIRGNLKLSKYVMAATRFRGHEVRLKFSGVHPV